MTKVLFSAVLLTIAGVAVASEPGFDMMNKSGGPVTVLVNNGYQNIAKGVVKTASTLFGKTITPNDLAANIDINQPTLLVVYIGSFPNSEIEPFQVTPQSSPNVGTERFIDDWMIVGPKERGKPSKIYLYHFAPGKKIYVTLEGNGALRPQQGSSGVKSAAGYSLANNVTQADIFRRDFDEYYAQHAGPQRGMKESYTGNVQLSVSDIDRRNRLMNVLPKAELDQLQQLMADSPAAGNTLMQQLMQKYGI